MEKSEFIHSLTHSLTHGSATAIHSSSTHTAQFAAKRSALTWEGDGARTQKEKGKKEACGIGIRLQKYKKMVGISTVRSYAINCVYIHSEPPAELWREGRDGRKEGRTDSPRVSGSAGGGVPNEEYPAKGETAERYSQ